MNNETPSDEQCPVCGYYCLGNGGLGCIDKPSMIEELSKPVEDADVSELIRWHRDQAVNRVNAKKKEAHYNRANLIERLVRERDQSADLYADWKCLADGQSELIEELQAKVEKLEAGIATLWEVNECSDDLNEFRDLLCDLTGKERQ